MIPPFLQAPRRSRLPHRRRVSARGAGEVYSAWASLNAAPLVGAASARVVARRAAGAAAARSLRLRMPGGVQDAGARGAAGDASARNGAECGDRIRRRTAPRVAPVHRRLRQLGQRRQSGVPRYRTRPRSRRALGGDAPSRGPVRGRRAPSPSKR